MSEMKTQGHAFDPDPDRSLLGEPFCKNCRHASQAVGERRCFSPRLPAVLREEKKIFDLIDGDRFIGGYACVDCRLGRT